MAKKIKTITIDTSTAIQNNLFMEMSKKADFDVWHDFGAGLWNMITFLQNKGFEIILVLGEPGTGKTVAMRNLEPETNLWFNCDRKNPTFPGGFQQYGSKNKPTKFQIQPKTYEELYTILDVLEKKNVFEDQRYAILTGHIGETKSGFDVKQHWKTLGKQMTKMQLEGRLETVLYAEIIDSDGKKKYMLRTENKGLDTARAPMGLFPEYIESDYQFLITELDKYYNA